MNLNDLKQVIPYKFRIQSYSKNKPSAQCVAYIDARDVMDLLDQVCGVENWQCSYKEIKNNIYCEISIFINGQWVSKMDCGTESKTEAEKGEASDSFKRAAVKWGIGRFLYEIPMQFVKTDAVKEGYNYPNVVDDNGKRVFDLSEYLMKKVKLETTGRKPESNSKSQKEILSDSEILFKEAVEKINNSSSLAELEIHFSSYYKAIKDSVLRKKLQDKASVKKVSFPVNGDEILIEQSLKESMPVA